MVYLIASNSSITEDGKFTTFALENKDIIDANGAMRYEGSVYRPDDNNNPFYSHWRAFQVISDSGFSFWDYYGGIYIPAVVGTPAAPSTWTRDDEFDWQTYAFSFIQD